MSHFCSNCGSKMEDGVRFCSNCGAQDTYQIKVEDEGAYGEPQSSYSAPELTLDETFGEVPSYPKVETTPSSADIPELTLDETPYSRTTPPEQPAAAQQPQNTYTAPPYTQQQEGAGQQNTYQTPPYTQQQPQMNANGKPPGYGLSIASLIFGLLGGFLGLIFGIIALAKNRAKDKGVQIRSILGIVFWVFWMIILLVT